MTNKTEKAQEVNDTCHHCGKDFHNPYPEPLSLCSDICWGLFTDSLIGRVFYQNEDETTEEFYEACSKGGQGFNGKIAGEYNEKDGFFFVRAKANIVNTMAKRMNRPHYLNSDKDDPEYHRENV